MRTIRYKTSWSYLGPGSKRQEKLADFILDVLYLMEGSGVIPPLHVLNEVLQNGRSGGGMGPGTSWRPFRLSQEEYAELVSALLDLDVAEAKKVHPYVRFNKIVLDNDLEQAENYIKWLQVVTLKYGTG